MRTKHRFFWPQMISQIKEFVRNCDVCAQNKSGAQNQQAPMQSIAINEPFVFWAMDYMEPLPDIARDKTPLSCNGPFHEMVRSLSHTRPMGPRGCSNSCFQAFQSLWPCSCYSLR